MDVTQTDVDPGQETSDPNDVQVAVSFEGVLRQLQRRTAGEIVQLMTENAELRATLEVAKAELGTYRGRCEALEGIVAALTGDEVQKAQQS